MDSTHRPDRLRSASARPPDAADATRCPAPAQSADGESTHDLPGELEIRTGLRPGDLGRVVYLHGTLYAAEQGWDHTFEAYVARPLAEFALRTNPRECIWLVVADAEIQGCIAIVESDALTAQLRWFLLHPRLRSRGVGRALLERALEFSRGAGYRSVYLWTVRGLEAAARLYRQFGFELTAEETHPLWGHVVCEQRYELPLSQPRPAALRHAAPCCHGSGS